MDPEKLRMYIIIPRTTTKITRRATKKKKSEKIKIEF